MSPKELVAAAKVLANTLTDDEKNALFRNAMLTSQRCQDERAKRLQVTQADLERVYDL